MKFGWFPKEIDGKEIEEYIVWMKRWKNFLIMVHSRSVGFVLLRYDFSWTSYHIRFWRLKLLT